QPGGRMRRPVNAEPAGCLANRALARFPLNELDPLSRTGGRGGRSCRRNRSPRLHYLRGVALHVGAETFQVLGCAVQTDLSALPTPPAWSREAHDAAGGAQSFQRRRG